MIAACPKCSARYRVDPERIGAGGARLKCARCAAVFRVRAPAPAAPEAPESRAEAAASSARATHAEEPPPSSESDEQATRVDRDRLVVVADPEVDSGKRSAAAIASWGLHPILVHDGVEAMLSIQRMRPRAVVLDAALPKMFGFQVCEVVKRNESLCDTTVALVGAIHHKDRYRRPPSDLYGADLYLERPDLPDALLPLLRQTGMPVTVDDDGDSDGQSQVDMERSVPVEESAPAGAPVPVEESAPAGAPVPVEESASAGAPAPVSEPASAAAPVPVAAATPEPLHAPAPDGLADERAKAERLARIIISDIVLYNAEKFEAALSSGAVRQALDAELEEGRSLFVQRIDARVREERDYLADELERVARERGGQ